ncbi:MAG: hypothetical protein JWN41_823 [Thermoleophilia bacterium]|nr:hypothetical protein [Thermoleophilia bacterium]
MLLGAGSCVKQRKRPRRCTGGRVRRATVVKNGHDTAGRDENLEEVMAYVLKIRGVLLGGGLIVAAAALLLAPGSSSAATLVDPVDGAHSNYLQLATMVQFDPAANEHPKWVLLATDPAMKTTVRYCRQFVWAATADGKYHWGCNRWATGVDQYTHADRLLALEAGHTYYWQVVSADAQAKDVVSAVRSFTIDAKPAEPTVAEIGSRVMGTVFDDGTQLNLGAAAFVNSGVRVKTVHSTRISTYGFRIKVTNLGGADLSRSYVRVKSAAGTRYLRLRKVVGGEQAVWILNAAERRLKNKRFSYQAFLASTTNGALVRSQARVVLVKHVTTPKWTPDSKTSA